MKPLATTGEAASALWRRLWPLYCLSLSGLWPLAARVEQEIGRLESAAVGAHLVPMVAAVLVQTALLLLVACLAGGILAHRLGLVSLLAQRLGFARFREELPLAVVLGAALGGMLVMLDHWVFMPWLGLPETVSPVAGDGAMRALLLGLLYGGVSEEIIFRWGLMTFICWGCMRLAGRHQATLPRWLAWIGIVLSAAVFALAHLPVAGQAGGLDGLTASRLLSLNTLAGIVFGWLYWRRSLESACVAHAVVHVCFWGLA